MCLRCHQAFTDDEVLGQLQSNENDLKFDQWNDTSISHLCIAYIGFNGKECSDVAKGLLDKYIEWTEAHPVPEKNPDSPWDLFFGRPTAQSVRDEIAKFTPIKKHIMANDLTKDQIIEYLDTLDREDAKQFTGEPVYGDGVPWDQTWTWSPN